MKEKIDIKDFITDIANNNEEFREVCQDDSDKYAVMLYLNDNINLDYDFPSGKLYELVRSYEERGDGKDETTQYGIIKRISDGKEFKLWIHDAGFIGPDTLTLCTHLESLD